MTRPKRTNNQWPRSDALLGMATGSKTLTWAPRSWIAVATSSAGESLMSSESGLNAMPSTPTVPSREHPANQVPCQLHHPSPASRVDRVDLAQKSQCIPDAQFGGPSHERADVLRQAAATEPEPRTQESRSDTRVSAENLGQHGHITPGNFTDSDIALMKDIFVARNEFAAAFVSSAVARSVAKNGAPADSGTA